MKTVLAFTLFICITINGYTQSNAGRIDTSEIGKPGDHYVYEYLLDEPSDLAAWSELSPGLKITFAPAGNQYYRCEIPECPVKNFWEETGWRGERINLQILTWSKDTTRQIRITAGDLIDAAGHKISSANIHTRLVRYVVSNFRSGAVNFTCDITNDSAWLLPDRLEIFERFDLSANTVRPIWIRIDIPADTEPGVYTGNITVIWDGGQLVLGLKLKVQEMTLPSPSRWKFRLDLWQNPWVVAHFYKLEPWSDAHLTLLKKHLQPYAEAGGKYITTYAVHSPWADNSYYPEGTMIEWIKTSDGGWKFDFTVFDNYVELCMEAGIDKAITIYTPIPWGYRFRYLEETTGLFRYEEWSPDSPVYKEIWNIFLNELKSHLDQKNWFEKTYLGINENPMDITLCAIRVIKAHSPDWKITYAGDWHKELSQYLDDYSPVISSQPAKNEILERKASGHSTTFYVCCTPPRPNNFVFSPPAESRFIGWYAASAGYDGFLRWAYDAWPEDPLRDARHIFWPAGDCFLIYPGGESSVRFEQLRAGISDYEKINILYEMAGNSEKPEIKNLIDHLSSHLNKPFFSQKYQIRDFDIQHINDFMQTGLNLIEELCDSLSKVPTD